jgi:hypothetical protein
MAKLLQVTPEIAANEILLKEHWKEIKVASGAIQQVVVLRSIDASSKKRLK